MAHATARRTGLPRSGDVLRVSREASVQFAHPILFRVIRVHDWPTYTGWVWLDGYQLNADGEAVDRRSIFVQIEGLHHVSDPCATPTGRRDRNGGSLISPPRRRPGT